MTEAWEAPGCCQLFWYPCSSHVCVCRCMLHNIRDLNITASLPVGSEAWTLPSLSPQMVQAFAGRLRLCSTFHDLATL